MSAGTNVLPGNYEVEYTDAYREDGFAPDEAKERQALFKVLLAMYARSYKFDGADELLAMVRIADFCHALPILSSSLTTALLFSKSLIQYNAVELIFVAKQLKQPFLFRECLIYLIARSEPRKADNGELEEDLGELSGLVRNSYGNFWQKMKCSHSIKRREMYGYYKEVRDESQIMCDQHLRDDATSIAAHWYIGLYDIVEPLFECKSIFPRGALGHSFYCAEISDEDLPWDTNGEQQ